MKILVILQGPAYGDERAYNGLRLAGNLAKRDGVDVRIFFCFGDAVGCAVDGQQLPDGSSPRPHAHLRRPTRRRDRPVQHLHERPKHHRRHAHRPHPPIQPGRGHRLDPLGRQDRHLLRWLSTPTTSCHALGAPSPDNLTTEQTAAVLGVSRPTVVRMIDAGKLPARMVGTHRRLALGDVLAYRELAAQRRRAALDDMTRQAEELGLYD